MPVNKPIQANDQSEDPTYNNHIVWKMSERKSVIQHRRVRTHIVATDRKSHREAEKLRRVSSNWVQGLLIHLLSM